MTLAMITLMSIMAFSSCNNSRLDDQALSANESQEAFQSKNIKGQWTTDKSTAMELRAMRASMENFNLLIKKQPQNLDAYRGYAEVLQNHIDRTVKYCSLDQNAKSLLCKDLDKIREQIMVIENADINRARQAAAKINELFSHIDSQFNFDY